MVRHQPAILGVGDLVGQHPERGQRHLVLWLRVTQEGIVGTLAGCHPHRERAAGDVGPARIAGRRWRRWRAAPAQRLKRLAAQCRRALGERRIGRGEEVERPYQAGEQHRVLRRRLQDRQGELRHPHQDLGAARCVDAPEAVLEDVEGPLAGSDSVELFRGEAPVEGQAIEGRERRLRLARRHFIQQRPPRRPPVGHRPRRQRHRRGNHRRGHSAGPGAPALATSSCPAGPPPRPVSIGPQ